MSRGWRSWLVSVLLLVPAAAAAPIPDARASGSGVVISEFRFRGPTGASDEFVELVNASAATVDLSGWRLQGCSASGSVATRVTLPLGTVLVPGQRLLAANARYSGAVAPDITWASGISDRGGVRLMTASGARVDGVAGSWEAATCLEGAPLALPDRDADHAFARRDAGRQDTDDNAADFVGPQPSDPQRHGALAPLPIHVLQGDGTASPLAGATVVIEGVVTGCDDEVGASLTSGRRYPAERGLFVQSLAGADDGNPATPEGIFVGGVEGVTSFPRGSVVRAVGVVRESFGHTVLHELPGMEPVVIGGAALPPAITIDPALANSQDAHDRPYFEALEGMRVRLDRGVAVSGGTNHFGELFLLPGENRRRVFRTDAAPGLLALDDDAGAGNPANPYRDPDGSVTRVSADLFDTVDGAEGPLAFAFGSYRIVVQPGALPYVHESGVAYPWAGLAPAAPDQLRIVALNAENYLAAGSDVDLGIVTAEEEALKRARLADAIDRLLLRPAIVAVQEVENRALLAALARELGGYRAILREGNDARGIDVGFLVRDDLQVTAVRQHGKRALAPVGLVCSDVEGRLFDRPPLAIDVVAPGGLAFTVVNVHFASRAAPDACREAQAAFVRRIVAGIEARGGEAIVAGDFNAFEDEPALLLLEGGRASLTNLWPLAPEGDRYSYAYQGRLQTLDHILVTDGLASRAVDFRYAHVNVDYAERAAQPDGHRVSDHDPPVLTLEAGAP